MNRRTRISARAVWVGLLALGFFAVAAVAQTYEVLRAFNTSDGELPTAGLIQGTDGNLYGTTDTGGASGFGTIFKIDTTGSTFVTLHSFVKSDGSDPEAALIQGTDGNLYGTTVSGGSGVCPECGTIFKIDTTGSTFTTLHNFAGGNDGASPVAGLIQGTDGNLYGTTAGGGASNYGTIFKIDTSGSTLTTLHSFEATAGVQPYAGLIQGMDGNLYGTTNYGPNGFAGYGTIFKIDTSGSTFTTLHIFDYSTDGAYPYAALIQGSDGDLYGTTYYGVGNLFGTIFKIDTGGTLFTTLYHFTFTDGSNPYARLIQGTDGNLYGTTIVGGANFDYGTIFKIDTSGSTFTTLHSFAGSDGALPYGGVIEGTDGNLYGTALAGGANGVGVVFRLRFSQGVPRVRPLVPPSARPAPRLVVRP